MRKSATTGEGQAAEARPAASTVQPRPPAPAARRGEFRTYRSVVPGSAESDAGLFTVHAVNNRILYEIPDSLLDKEMLLVSRIARTATNLGYGGDESNRQVVRWQRNDRQVLLRTVSHQNVASDSLPIFTAVRNSNFEPIIRAFDIQAMGPDSASVVIDVTDLFSRDISILGLSPGMRVRYRVRRLDESRSFIVSTRSFPQNIEVRNVLTYDAAEPPSNGSTNTITLEMHHSMVLLPENPMQPRLWDERVGYFRIQQTDYGLDEQRAAQRRYITRWRLEPNDPEAFARGELVEPVKPIVFYIDPATPEKWRPYLKQGVEDWQIAFEAAGFKNAIMAKNPPSEEEDPDFSLEDIRYSVIRYLPSRVQNARGPHIHDPRTGEILESNIEWYHNVMNLLRNWYFVQTAAVNEKARAVRFEDDVMGELIRFVSAHEVGHTLGLAHNMKASSAYPVDSLRSATFTAAMGTSPSIMDYARFNYVAQPEDNGVALMPKVGPYDIYAVKWGYRPIHGAGSPDDEKPVLDGWVRAREHDPIYRFGDRSTIDPTAQTEDLGDDPVKASQYGIANLKRIVPNLVKWTYEAKGSYGELNELYLQVIAQWNRYMGHVVTNIGGVYQTRRTHDQVGPVYELVPREKQEQALAFLAEEAFQTPAWMLNENVLSRIEAIGVVERIRNLQVGTLNQILHPERMQRVIESEARFGRQAYTLDHLLTDVRRAVWRELSSGAAIDLYRRNLQRGYIERVELLMTREPAPVPARLRALIEVTDVNVSQSDIRPLLRGELQVLQQEIERALRRTSDRTTRLHLEDASIRIDRVLEPRGAVVAGETPAAPSSALFDVHAPTGFCSFELEAGER